jgi:predicted kinase
MQRLNDGNAEGYAEYGRDCLDQRACAALTDNLRRELARRAALLDRRRSNGLVRQCHGDLHLRNIVLLDGDPTPFDGVEFNDEISCVDVFYDLAVLLMDLWRRALTRHANALLNGYLAQRLDFEALALLPLFLSCRAAIRAKTSATAAGLQQVLETRRELEALAREYLVMAADLLRVEPPVLVAIGGCSGSGKSTLAQSLAPDLRPVPGAVVARSDLMRKALAGVPSLKRLPADAYTPEASARVYRALGDRARVSLEAGQPVIVDAVFGSAADRAAIEAVAARAAVPFIGIWLEAPADVLIGRVARREADASDADAQVVRAQLAVDPGHVRWTRVDASGEAEAILARVRAQLRDQASALHCRSA